MLELHDTLVISLNKMLVFLSALVNCILPWFHDSFYHSLIYFFYDVFATQVTGIKYVQVEHQVDSSVRMFSVYYSNLQQMKLSKILQCNHIDYTMFYGYIKYTIYIYIVI